MNHFILPDATLLYFLGRLSKPHHDSPFAIFSSSYMISSSSCPDPLTTSQKVKNSSFEITPSLFTSTVLKNSLADILPKALFQCLTASSLSISFEPSTSKIPKTSSIFFLTSGDKSYNKQYDLITNNLQRAILYFPFIPNIIKLEIFSLRGFGVRGWGLGVRCYGVGLRV